MSQNFRRVPGTTAQDDGRSNQCRVFRWGYAGTTRSGSGTPEQQGTCASKCPHHGRPGAFTCTHSRGNPRCTQRTSNSFQARSTPQKQVRLPRPPLIRATSKNTCVPTRVKNRTSMTCVVQGFHKVRIWWRICQCTRRKSFTSVLSAENSSRKKGTWRRTWNRTTFRKSAEKNGLNAPSARLNTPQSKHWRDTRMFTLVRDHTGVKSAALLLRIVVWKNATCWFTAWKSHTSAASVERDLPRSLSVTRTWGHVRKKGRIRARSVMQPAFTQKGHLTVHMRRHREKSPSVRWMRQWLLQQFRPKAALRFSRPRIRVKTAEPFLT